MDSTARQQRLQPYKPPQWAEGLNIVPQYRVQLANVNTPIQRWYLPGVPDGFEVYIKRDDMLGCDLSGNKVRKLEFVLADAIDQGCTSVITSGGIQSNHCCSTAIAARQLGLTPYLLLRSAPDSDSALCVGNAFLDRLIGSHIYLIPSTIYVDNKKYLPWMQKLAHALKQEKGEDAYVIPVGGSAPLSVYGYLEGFNELLQQRADTKFSDIAVATSSGGTIEGLAIGNYLTNSNIKCHGLTTLGWSNYFREHINDTLKNLGLWEKCGRQSEGIAYFIDGGLGKEYTVVTQEEIDFIADVSIKTGIFTDPMYTGRAAFHLVKQLQEHPERFRGNKILFIHTGGMFSLFAGRMNTVLKSPGASSIQNWMELADEVPCLP